MMSEHSAPSSGSVVIYTNPDSVLPACDPLESSALCSPRPRRNPGGGGRVTAGPSLSGHPWSWTPRPSSVRERGAGSPATRDLLVGRRPAPDLRIHVRSRRPDPSRCHSPDGGHSVEHPVQPDRCPRTRDLSSGGDARRRGRDREDRVRCVSRRPPASPSRCSRASGSESCPPRGSGRAHRRLPG
jgi:hypothetical protein